MFKKPKTLQDPNDYDHAWQYALFLLNLSMRTVSEVEQKMVKRGYGKKVVIQVINNLKEDKFLDDDNYAEVFINSMKNYKTWGRFMMKKKMLEKKLPTSLIEQKLSELVTDEDELEIAKRFVSKQINDSKALKKLDYQEKQKLMRKLMSRGFAMDTVVKLF